MLSPQGFYGLLFPLRLTGMSQISFIREWNSTSFAKPAPLELALLVALYVFLTRGVKLGVFRLLVLLGLWGALIPLVGPYFHYAYTPDTAWHLTAGRIWLEIVPGAAVLVGGVLLMVSASRPTAMFGAWLAAAGFVDVSFLDTPSPSTLIVAR